MLFLSVSVAIQLSDANQVTVLEESLTVGEKQYLSAARLKGGLVIATRISEHVYYPREKESTIGFYYKLLQNCAKELSLPLTFTVVQWNDYFSKDGAFPEQVRTEPNFIYTPDLMKTVDLYMDAFTLSPWREKILLPVKLFPIKTMAVTRKGEELVRIEELKNRRIAVQPVSTYADTLREIEKRLKTEFHYLKIQTFAQGLEAVSKGEADVTCMDSHDAWIVRYPNLTLSLPLSDIQYICVFTAKTNPMLASILEKYMAHAHETGLFETYWQEAYKISFNQYLNLIFRKP